MIICRAIVGVVCTAPVIERILGAMSHKVLIIFPMMSITQSSAYPWEYTPCLLNHFSRLSATADDNVGDKPPPCSNPCLVVTVMYV